MPKTFEHLKRWLDLDVILACADKGVVAFSLDACLRAPVSVEEASAIRGAPVFPKGALQVAIVGGGSQIFEIFKTHKRNLRGELAGLLERAPRRKGLSRANAVALREFGVELLDSGLSRGDVLEVLVSAGAPVARQHALAVGVERHPKKAPWLDDFRVNGVTLDRHAHRIALRNAVARARELAIQARSGAAAFGTILLALTAALNRLTVSEYAPLVALAEEFTVVASLRLAELLAIRAAPTSITEIVGAAGRVLVESSQAASSGTTADDRLPWATLEPMQRKVAKFIREAGRFVDERDVTNATNCASPRGVISDLVKKHRLPIESATAARKGDPTITASKGWRWKSRHAASPGK